MTTNIRFPVFDETPQMCSPKETPSLILDDITMDLIDRTRHAIKNLSQQQKFERAEIHLEDALKYKNPRIQLFEQNISTIFKICYAIQNSIVWQTMITAFCFMYMYLVTVEVKTSGTTAGNIISPCILAIFWIDFILEIIHRNFDMYRKKSRISMIIYVQGVVLFLLSMEQILISIESQINGRPFLPFRILRGLMPIIYISQVRRSFQAIIYGYKYVIIYFIFYSLIVLFFAIIGSTIISLPSNTSFDPYTGDYNNLEKMVFIMYVTATYDAYPDNQITAVRANLAYYFFFIGFIFLNMFLYSSIPGSIYFDAYINARAKFILIDEIKMQHSLVLAFVSLGEENYEIDISKIIDFLNYLFDYRVRFVDNITEICLKMNDDGNCTIHLLEFIQLGRILQENSALKPPIFKDVSKWIKFRTYINSKVPLNKFFQSKIYQNLLGLLVIFSFINALLCLYAQSLPAPPILNQIFVYIYLLLIILTLIGTGFQNYFTKIWNQLDLVFFLISFVMLYPEMNTNYSALFNLFRLPKATLLMKNIISSSYCDLKFEIYEKIEKLAGTIVIILPIIIRFFMIFMVVYFILGVIGMEIFYQEARKTKSATYGVYDQFSNFRQFVFTQFYFVQVLTEAGWSSVAFDYASRSSSKSFFFIMLFFACCHILIVLIMATILKGIVWFVFLTVSQQYGQREKVESQAKENKEKLNKKIEEFTQVRSKVEKGAIFVYNTVMKRQLYEAKSNTEILRQLVQENYRLKFTKQIQKSINLKLHKNFIQNQQQLQKQLRNNIIKAICKKEVNNFLFTLVQNFNNMCRSKLKQNQIKNLQDMQEVQDYDLEENLIYLSRIFQLISSKFNYRIKNDEIISQYVSQKLVSPFKMIQSSGSSEQGEKQSIETLYNQKQSLDFRILSLHILLGLETSKREQKQEIIKSFIDAQIIDQYDGKQLLGHTITEKSHDIDDNYIIRKMYLADTSKNIIGKFQAEYFGDVYGNVFKETNKITIEPLIKVQSNITYALKKLMRYPEISSSQFFKILTKIQEDISNKLLKKGSLFKFIYKLNHSSNDIWFTIDYNTLNEPKLSFLKNGVWLYNSKLIEHQIYYGEDIFNHNNTLPNFDLQDKTILIKKLFQTFETLALSLPNYEDFFTSNAAYNVYDTYLNYIDVSKLQRYIPKTFEIEKIMAVLLTKEQERKSETSKITYPISDIEIQKPYDAIDFQLDQTQSESFEKLTNLCDLNDEEITANQGLPFEYVLNFMCEVDDILKLYGPNFVHQVEKVVNQEFGKIKSDMAEKQDYVMTF